MFMTQKGKVSGKCCLKCVHHTWGYAVLGSIRYSCLLYILLLEANKLSCMNGYYLYKNISTGLQLGLLFRGKEGKMAKYMFLWSLVL